jgi:oligopeptide transport system substrate-binding protein
MRLSLSGVRAIKGIAVIAVMAVAAACGGGTSGGGGVTAAPASQQNLRVNFEAGSEPGTLDPVQQLWVYEAQVDRNVFEALLKAKADLSDVQGAAAQSYDVSSDGLTYTFHLRKDGKWSDGKPVTAQDFVYGYKRLLDPRIAAPYVEGYFDVTIAGAANYANIDPKDTNAVNSFLNGLGVSAPDPNTFVIKLSKPSGFFKWTVTLWLAAPERQDMVEKVGSDKFGAVNSAAVGTVIGNGPFMLSEVVPKDHITLVPNPYYRTKAKLQKVTLEEIGDPNVAYTKYQTGDLDMVDVPTANAASVKSDPKLSKELHQLPTLLTWWIDINTTKAPFTNQKLRLAFAKGFNRTQFLNNVEHGVGSELDTFIPKGERGYSPDLGNIQKFDASAAKSLIQQSGVSQSDLANIPLLYNSDSTASKTASEFLQAQWQQNLGINVQLVGVDRNTWTHRVHKGDYTIAYQSGWSADYPDGQDWFDIFLTGGGSQFSKYSNPQYDDLVHKGDAATSQTQRDNYYHQAQQLLLTDAPMIITFQGENFFLAKPYLTGLTFTPMDDDTWYGDVITAATMYVAKH